MESGAMFGDVANWIFLGLALYIIMVIGVGLFFNRRIKECDDHVVAGRNIPFIYMVGSVTATWLCAGAILGAAGYAYMFGLQGTIYDPWAPALTLILSGLFFTYRLRQAGYTSVVDFYDSRYGRKMSILYDCPDYWYFIMDSRTAGSHWCYHSTYHRSQLCPFSNYWYYCYNYRYLLRRFSRLGQD